MFDISSHGPLNPVPKCILVTLSQHLVVSEGICAMLGLVLLDETRELPGKTAVWAALTHNDKQVLLHDRVLSAASDDGEFMPPPRQVAYRSHFLVLSRIGIFFIQK